MLLALTLGCPAWGESAVWASPGATSGSIYYTGGNVGIGTSAPDKPLTVAGDVHVFGKINVNDWSEGYFIGNQAGFYMPINTLDLRLQTASTDRVSITYAGDVGIGVVNPQYKLSVNGNIGAKDIVVTNTGWPDYVFKPGYRLRPLAEISHFIRAHGHLPDIPTEAEVRENGVSLGDMQAKLLAKVEELTLHIIEQDEENRELRARVARLENAAEGSSTRVVGK